MREIEILGDNRFETFTKTRAGSRAVIVRDGMILLTHETRSGWWLVPGGGMEEGETPEECCVREVQEETGYIVRPLRQFLTINEYYEEYRYIDYYFICEAAGTGETHLTDAEVRRGIEPQWIPLQEAVDIFSRHQSYAAVSEEKRGAYLREYTALQEYLNDAASPDSENGAHHNFLFDLDQTLLDFHASEYKALGIVLTSNGLSFSDEIYRAFKAYNKALWLELEKGTISRNELFTKRFLDVFSRCEGDASGLDPLKVNDDFIRTMSVNGVLMDGALEFVRRVKENIPDARIYIASNGATVNAKGRIASTGLDRYIDGLFISEDMGVTKPDAKFFDLCLEKIGEPRSSCIMIGDSLSSDMLGAKNASLASVWFMPSGNVEEAVAAYGIDYCASSFDELYEVLRKWAAGT